MHPVVLLALYFAVALAPLVLSVLQGLPPRRPLDELATGLGMVAFAILLVEFVLSGRFRLISGRVGMDVTMRLHQLLARTALVFLLVHPFLYRTPFNPPLPWDGTRQATLDLDIFALTAGLCAWVALPAFMFMSIYRDHLGWRYETWRVMHAVGALVIVGLIGIHAFEIGRYSAQPGLGWFWTAMMAIALLTVIYTYLIEPIVEMMRPFEVKSVRKIALKTWEVAIRPAKGHSVEFEAGQFAWLNIGYLPFSVFENPFSISSAPDLRTEMQFVVKEAGDMTRRIGAVRTGTRAYIDGPHGNLTAKGRQAEGLALIAGGVGIAPLLSIARQYRAVGDNRPLILLYGNRVAEQIVYGEELAQIDAMPQARVIHVLGEPPDDWRGAVGRIDATVIGNTFAFDGAAEWLYLVCGPPAMLDTVEDALVARGIPGRQIVTERFYYE